MQGDVGISHNKIRDAPALFEDVAYATPTVPSILPFATAMY